MPLSPAQLAVKQAASGQWAISEPRPKRNTGPRTPEGKARSSQNARRHGVTAQTTVMTDEDRLHHDDFCNRMMADLAPIGSMEVFLASSVAEEAWRLNYTRAQCNNIVALGHFDATDSYTDEHPEVQTAIIAAETTRNQAKQLELLSLYEQRIHRKFQKHYDELKKAQAERMAKRKAELEDARLLSQMAKVQHLPYLPAQDEFVFSTDEIDSYTARHHRLRLAKKEEFKYMERFHLLELPEAA
jgi:hypothetical protein